MRWNCCGSRKKPIYKLTLETIFRKTKEFPMDKQGMTQQITDNTVEELRTHVKDRIKPLLDFLENNQRTLRSVGDILLENCQSGNPVDYLLTLFVLNNILPVIKNFSYDRGDMAKLIRKESAKRSDTISLNVLLNRNLAENFLYFEGKMIEVLDIMLIHNSKDIILPRIIETVAIYGNCIPSYESALSIKTSKQRMINKVLESEKLMPDLSNQNNIATQKSIVDGLYGITSNNDRKLTDDVKKELTDYLYKILIKCESSSPELSTSHQASQKKTELEKSIFSIILNILRNDFYFYDYDSTVFMLVRKFNQDDWPFPRIQEKFLLELLKSISSHPNLSTIEGALIDLFLFCLMSSEEGITEGNVEKSPGRISSPQPNSNFRLEQSGVEQMINFLKMIMEFTKVNMGTFFSIERIVVSLIRKVTVTRNSSNSQEELVLKTLTIILEKLIQSSPQVIFSFLESYLRELSIRIQDNEVVARFFASLNAKFCTAIIQGDSFSTDLTIGERLGTLMIQASNLGKKKSRDLWKGIVNLMAIVFNLNKEMPDSIIYIRIESPLLLPIIRHCKRNCKSAIDELLSIKVCVSVVALSFQIMIAIMLRKNISDVGLITAFFRQLKRDVIDKNQNSQLHNILKVYWIYSLFILSKRWRIDSMNDLLSPFLESLNNQEIRKQISLLQKPDISTPALDQAVEVVQTQRDKILHDIHYQNVDSELRNFFTGITHQHKEEFALSFEKIHENQQWEKDVVIYIKGYMEKFDDDIDLNPVNIELKYLNSVVPNDDINSGPLTKGIEDLDTCIEIIKQTVGIFYHRKEKTRTC